MDSTNKKNISFEVLKQILDEKLANAWRQLGKRDGINVHSQLGFISTVDALSQSFNRILRQIIDSLEERVWESQVNLLQVDGADRELEAVAESSYENWKRQLGFFSQQILKDHTTDTTSICHFAIAQYREGFKEGWMMYLRTGGQPDSDATTVAKQPLTTF